MKHLALLLAIVLVSLVGIVGISQAAPDPAIQSIYAMVKDIQQQLQLMQQKLDTLQSKVDSGVSVVPKRYYLTAATVKGDQALNACEDGFHMASLFEILDPTSLQYAFISEAYQLSSGDDQGQGPPTDVEGWIRTGSVNQSGGGPGHANCFDWTKGDINGGGASGTVVAATPVWKDPLNTAPTPFDLQMAPWWTSDLHSCDFPQRVWCVEDR